MESLSVVIPAYNEAARLPPTLKLLRAFLADHVRDAEVLVVDDGSGDDTAQVAEELLRGWPGARLLRLERNQGKGGAVRAGVLAASKRNVVFMDADGSTDLEVLPRLYAALSDARPVIIGSRDVRGARITRHQHPLREVSAKAFNLWIQAWLLPGVWDTQCGFKLFRTGVARALFEPLQERRFGFDVEVLYRARRQGLPIVEVPVRWAHMDDSRVSPLRDGLGMALQVVRLRLRQP